MSRGHADPLRPSSGHTNRKGHNWLAYDTVDSFLVRSSWMFRGVLYDLGCGESPYKEWLLRHIDRYVGVDWAASPHTTRPDIITNLNEDLPIENNSADCVLALSVLEHLHEPQRMLSEASRILKAGGRLVLQVPWQWWIHEAPYDFYRYTPFGIRYLLDRAGFVEIEVTPQAGFFSTITLKLNYFTKRLIRGPLVVRLLLRSLFCGLWYLGQRLAPFFDRLDRNWALEAPGYFVTAVKPVETKR